MQAITKAEKKTRAVVKVDVTLPTLTFHTYAGTIFISGNEVVLDGAFSTEDVEEFRQDLKRALVRWLPLSLAEPIVKSVRKQRFINMVKQAYLSNGEIFKDILEKCRFEADPDERQIVIDASRLPPKERGLLVGKKGNTISQIEKKLNVSIQVTDSPIHQPLKSQVR